MTKHKHSDLIHAWADGAEIQMMNREGEWVSKDSDYWFDDYEYRIKPEEKKPVVRWLWAYQVGGGWAISDLLSEAEVKATDWVKLEWSKTEFTK